MADTLTQEQRDFLDKVARKVKVNTKPAVKSDSRLQAWFSGKFSTLHEAEPDARREALLADASVDSQIKGLDILQENVWNNLSKRDKKTVLSVVYSVLEIESRTLGGDETLINERDSVVESFKTALTNSGIQVGNLYSLMAFGEKRLTKLLPQLDAGSIEGASILVPSEEDLQIATILKMAGKDISFDGKEWHYDSEAPKFEYFNPKKTDGAFEVFSDDNVIALCKYLNTPQPRQERVVPSKLLQVYIEVYDAQMGAKDKSKRPEERRQISERVDDLRKKFTIGSDEYKITRLLDADTMLRNAQRQAMAEAFVSIIQTGEAAKDAFKAVSDLSVSSTNPAYRQAFKNLRRFSSSLDGIFEDFEDSTKYYEKHSVDHLKEYDEQIDILRRQEPNGKLLEELISARNCYERTLALQQVYWKTKLEMIQENKSGSSFVGNELARAINESVGFAVMQNDKGEFVMANGDAVKKFFEERGHSETFEELKAMLEKGRSQEDIVEYLKEKKLVPEAEHGASGPAASSGAGQPQKNSGSSLKYPEIFLQYLNDIVGMDFEAESNLLLDYSNLRLYQFMWEKDGVFDIGFRALKAEKPEATIDDFIKQFIEQQDSEANFNPELIEDAYYLTYKDGSEQSKLARAQSKLDAFNEQLLISDLMLGLFTPDELSHYNSLEAKEKTALLQVKNKGALKRLEELKKDPKAYEAALDLAKKRHEAGIVGSVIKQKWSNTRTAEQEAGVEPLVSTAIDKFISNLGQEQKANNQFLIENGQPIVVEEQPQQEPKQQEAKSGNTLGDTTFGDMYPSGPNVDQFLKRMKPYSAKAVKKNFIDKLLADLDKIKISKDAYYARMSSFTSSRDIFAQELTEEEKKQIDEQVQQQDKQIVTVKQRDFEASAFIPAYMMFERIKGSAKDDKAKVHADSLKNVFRYLATTGEIDVSDRLGVRTPDGKDVRDDLRSLALKICAGGFKGKGSDGVQQELAPILTKYGVDPVIQQEIKDAFLFMTPEVLAIALEPVSTIDDSNNLVIGSLLPHNLINAQDDRSRWASFQRDFRVDDHADTVEMLSDALGTIYRTKDGTEIDKDSIDYAYEVKLSHQKAEFGQVADTQELKRMRLAAKIAVYKKNGMEIPEELKKAALELNGQESATPEAEEEGMGPSD